MRSSRRRLGPWFALVAVLAVAGIASMSTSCVHGHVLRYETATNEARSFDFRTADCVDGPAPPAGAGEVQIQYLGVSGIYIRWRGHGLLAEPFFSNYGESKIGFGRVRPDAERIADGMADLKDAPIGAVLVGHSHYDHIGDVPEVVRTHAPDAEIWANRSGVRMLRDCEGLDPERLVTVEDFAGAWRQPSSPAGEPLPFRIMPIESGHADHIGGYHFAEHEVPPDWQGCLEGKRLAQLKEGRPHAYLIDLLDANGQAVFRIHHQGAAARRPMGIPPADVLDDRPIDLAVVCLPGAWQVEGYPEGLLEEAPVRHVLVSHYEDFMRDPDKPIRFVVMLTDDRAQAFVTEVAAAMDDPALPPIGPTGAFCGPGTPKWSMALPGEWLVFGSEDLEQQ